MFRSALILGLALVLDAHASLPNSPDEFLIAYRPQAQLLAEHLYKNASCKTVVEQTRYGTGSLDLAAVGVRFKEYDCEYVANRDRYRLTRLSPKGSRTVEILRPDGAFAISIPPSGAAVLDRASLFPTKVRDRIGGINWWANSELTSGNGFGIGLLLLGKDPFTALSDGTYQDLTLKTDTADGQTRVVLEGRNQKAGYKRCAFVFRWPSCILERVETDSEKPPVRSITDYTFEMRGDDITSFVPKSYENTKVPLQGQYAGKRYPMFHATVTEFRKGSHPDAAFGLAQYGLPEVGDDSTGTSWRSWALIGLAVAAGVVLLVRRFRARAAA